MSAIKVSVVEGLKMEALAPTAANQVVVDAPKELGGGGADMSPTDLLAVSLVSCMIVMMGLKARQLGANMAGTTGEVSKTMAMEPVMHISSFHVKIRCPNVGDPAHQAELQKAAEQCPVHHTLSPECKQDIAFEWGA